MKKMSEDYSGRQLDLEVLQHVTVPAGLHGLSITSTRGDNRKVTGIQKAIQRYVHLLLTPGSSRRFSRQDDNELMSSLVQGIVSNVGYLQHLFAVANASALDAIRKSDYNTAAYGKIPDDESIMSVTLNTASVDRSTSTISLSLTFTTLAGSEYTYIVPIKAGAR